MEPAWTSVPSEPSNADDPANHVVSVVPRRSRPLTKSRGLPAVVDRQATLSIGLTEEEEMDTYTVICIDGPGKDDDPVPLHDARETEVGDVVTLHGAEYRLLGPVIAGRWHTWRAAVIAE